MTRIRFARLILGGLLAGAVINTAEFVAVFAIGDGGEAGESSPAADPAPEAEAGEARMSGGEIAASNLWGFLVGFLAIWLYAAIRPRYGPGPGTAVRAATAVWALAVLLPAFGPVSGGGLEGALLLATVLVGLIEINLGTLLGAWQYREPAGGVER